MRVAATRGGLLRCVLSARGPIGSHPLGHRLLLFGVIGRRFLAGVDVPRILEGLGWSRGGRRSGGGRRVRPPRGPRGRAGSTLGSTRRVAGTTSEDLRSEGYTDRGRGTYSPRPRRATSRLSFCARPKRLSSARKPPSSLRPSSVGASSSAWRRTRSPRPGWPQPPAAARRSAEPRASPERRSRASCRRRSTPGSRPLPQTTRGTTKTSSTPARKPQRRDPSTESRERPGSPADERSERCAPSDAVSRQ